MNSKTLCQTRYFVQQNTLLNKIRRIQGKKHEMGTHEINKISLFVFDDKRFFLNDGIHMLAYFHKDTYDHKLFS